MVSAVTTVESTRTLATLPHIELQGTTHSLVEMMGLECAKTVKFDIYFKNTNIARRTI